MGAGEFQLIAKSGCLHIRDALRPSTVDRLRRLSDGEVSGGKRLRTDAALVVEAMTGDAVMALLGVGFRPVRAVLFDKSAARNWLVPWHQDRTIAVQSRIDSVGFGPWSVKQGVVHVEPPFALLAAMLTVRLHLDDCPATNAPLVVALGSHRKQWAADAAAARAGECAQLTCLAGAGDLWIYSTPILHRSGRATEPNRRRVLQIDFSSASLPDGLDWAN